MQNKTLVVITGGTIEALYSPSKGTPYYVPLPDKVEQSAIPEALERLGVASQCELFPLAMEDSKDVEEHHLEALANYVRAGHFTKVVVVHGTDTMASNGRHLDRLLKGHGVTDAAVIFTGAMRPLRNKHGEWHAQQGMDARDHSDGMQNLKLAFDDLDNKALLPGVYLEMGAGPQDVWSVDKTVETELSENVERPGKHVLHVRSSGFRTLPECLHPGKDLLNFWQRQQEQERARKSERSGTVGV